MLNGIVKIDKRVSRTYSLGKAICTHQYNDFSGGSMFMRTLNLHQLSTFQVVAKHCSFVRAAEELHFSQPAASLDALRNREPGCLKNRRHQIDRAHAALIRKSTRQAVRPSQQQRDLGAFLVADGLVAAAEPSAKGLAVIGREADQGVLLEIERLESRE